MSTTLRLYLSLHVTKLPLVAEIEFPESEAGGRLADLYRQSILFSKNTNKSLDQERQTRYVVAVKLPASLHDITYSRTHSSLVLHFNTAADAERFSDPLFSVVPDHARQLFLKPSWTAQEEASLKRSLLEQVEAKKANMPIWEEDRAGDSPLGDIYASIPGGGRR